MMSTGIDSIDIAYVKVDNILLQLKQDTNYEFSSYLFN